jgi:ubiquinone/menaquinone biosynthesis C-methylase UbiE
MKQQESQETIQNWFNQTYTKKGETYLRPKEAYYIYLELLKAQKNEKLLDIACGLGRLLEASQDYHVQPYGIDISSVAIEKVKSKFPHFKVQTANAGALPFEDKYFDLLTCIGSLERMLDLKKVLQEMIRVGKKDCRYCFLVRNSETITWKVKRAFGLVNKKGHQGAKNMSEWKQLFAHAGFEVLHVYPDQYPLIKVLKLKTLWLKKINYKQLLHSSKPIEYNNEFLFLLRKK